MTWKTFPTMVWNKIDWKMLRSADSWEEAATSVRAEIFGEMVQLAAGRVKYYVSDLYHDATWLRENVNGPMSFEWVARESGTFIGGGAEALVLEEWSYENPAKYRFELLAEGRYTMQYTLVIYQAMGTESYPEH